MNHQWVEHHNCAERNCLFCEGGLRECVMCGLAEGCLTTDCPGKESGKYTYAVYHGLIDYQNGEWVPDCSPHSPYNRHTQNERNVWAELNDFLRGCTGASRFVRIGCDDNCSKPHWCKIEERDSLGNIIRSYFRQHGNSVEEILKNILDDIKSEDQDRGIGC